MLLISCEGSAYWMSRIQIRRGWWNRQTREFEGLVVEIPCGFKSRPAHQPITIRMNSANVRLQEILRRTSVKSSGEAVFRLASGKMSRHYVDCKQALSDPEARILIGQLMLERLNGTLLDAVGGMELGA